MNLKRTTIILMALMDNRFSSSPLMYDLYLPVENYNSIIPRHEQNSRSGIE